MLASDCVDAARLALFDPAPGAGWSDAELLTYLNEAIRDSVAAKPDIYPVSGDIPLAAGVVQTLPAGGVLLIDITHNSDTGRTVSVVDLPLLQEANRFWPAATQQAEVENFAVDPRTPRKFLVSPPNNGLGQVYGTYGGTPSALTATSDTFPLLDLYQPAMTAYVISRAYAKNSKRQDPAKAATYRQQWAQALGAKSVATATTLPRVSQSPDL